MTEHETGDIALAVALEAAGHTDVRILDLLDPKDWPDERLYAALAGAGWPTSRILTALENWPTCPPHQGDET